MTDHRPQDDIVGAIGRAHTALRARTARAVRRESGLGLSEWRILALIGDDGLDHAAAIGAQGGLDKGLLSRALRKLEQRGLIESTADPYDTRVQRLSVTEPGRALLERAGPGVMASRDRITATLSREDRAQLVRLLSRVAPMDR